MSRNFFLDSSFTVGKHENLTPKNFADDIKHLQKVLRIEVGDTIRLINGRGDLAEAEILSSTKNNVEICILNNEKVAQDKIQVRLVQSVLKGQRMDWILEKISELGVSSIQPIISEHAIPKVSDCKSKEQRWLRICQAALKQSGHPFLVDIKTTTPLQDALSVNTKDTLRIALHVEEQSKQSLLNTLSEQLNNTPELQTIEVWIGPEGGFSIQESELLKQHGFLLASLGESILRAETAAIVACAIAKQIIFTQASS